MSDFDKEAEREKLRKKFEQEDEKREATEQMSELLLKGATMTNAHCSDCGDPIFRYDGQEFCPTCQKPITRKQDDQQDEDGSSGDQIEMANPGDDARVQFGGADGEEPTTAESAPHSDGAEASPQGPPAETRHATDAESARTTPHETGGVSPSNSPEDLSAQNSRSTASETNSTTDQRSQTTQPNPPASTRTTDSTDDVQANLGDAERLLAQTIRQFAERAATTDNPRRAKEHLEAAREAAEALDATSR